MAYVKQIKAKNSSTATSDTTFDIKAMAVEKDAAVQNSANDMSAGAVVRNIGYGTAAPSGGYNGDIYVQLQGANSLIDLIYPVDSIYISANSTNPGTWMTGTTWIQLEDRFLLGAGSTYTAGDTGGEASHILTASELPSHDHNINGLKNTPSGTTGKARVSVQEDGNIVLYHLPSTAKYNIGVGGTATSGYSPAALGQNGGLTGKTGDGTAHNNLPPYLVVYIWKRIS